MNMRQRHMWEGIRDSRDYRHFTYIKYAIFAVSSSPPPPPFPSSIHIYYIASTREFAPATGEFEKFTGFVQRVSGNDIYGGNNFRITCVPSPRMITWVASVTIKMTKRYWVYKSTQALHLLRQMDKTRSITQITNKVYLLLKNISSFVRKIFFALYFPQLQRFARPARIFVFANQPRLFVSFETRDQLGFIFFYPAFSVSLLPFFFLFFFL